MEYRTVAIERFHSSCSTMGSALRRQHFGNSFQHSALAGTHLAAECANVVFVNPISGTECQFWSYSPAPCSIGRFPFGNRLNSKIIFISLFSRFHFLFCTHSSSPRRSFPSDRHMSNWAFRPKYYTVAIFYNSAIESVHGSSDRSLVRASLRAAPNHCSRIDNALPHNPHSTMAIFLFVHR